MFATGKEILTMMARVVSANNNGYLELGGTLFADGKDNNDGPRGGTGLRRIAGIDRYTITVLVLLPRGTHA